MIKARKLVALVLAFLMIFGSVSVLASAWDATVDDGKALNITTKFFKEVDGVWTETTKVKPGDVVKARVYLGTDYYSNDSTLLFFYDKDFFEHSYAGLNELEVNTAADSFAQTNEVSGYFSTDSDLSAQVSADVLNDYNAFVATVEFKNNQNVMFDGSDWLCEFTLTVAADASGEGDLFVIEETIQSTSRTNAVINVPKGEQGGVDADVWPMWVWDAEVTLDSQPVSTMSSVTFKANGGEFAAGEPAPIEGMIDAEIKSEDLPADPTRDGYTFMGWIDANDTTPTLEEAGPAPTAIPENDLVLNAFWLKNVNITFNTDGGNDIAAIENVTPYTDFAEIADPVKDGYTFVGWDVRGGDLPATYPDVDTTYTAIWALNVTVSFNTNGADEIAPIEGYAGADFDAVIADPQKEGHYFVGWIIEGTGSLVDLPTVFPEADVTYEAIFDTYTYGASYEVLQPNGKTKYYDLQVEYGQKVPTPVVDVPEGYVLDGWYTDADYQTKFVEGELMGTAPITLYAKFEILSFDAIFQLDGGNINGDTADVVVNTVFGEEIVPPANPVKTGYVFNGWTPYVGILDKEEDVYFTATWVEANNDVTYYYNYEGAGIYEAYDIDFGQELEVPADPEREGYTFVGWAEAEDATADAVINLHGATMPADAVKYYAVWQVNEYTITFDVDGGTEIEAATYDFGEAVIAPAEPTKTGYTFAGWEPALPATMPAKDITVKAQWTINQYTITFDTVGGTAIEAITQDYNTAVTAPADPTKVGYTFAGWDVEIPATMPAEDVTITAKWTINQYTITFDTDGGSAIEAITQDYNTAVTAPADPTKTGYTFAGWDIDVPTTMPAENVTVKAQWTINQYTITFDTDGGNAIEAITGDYGTAVVAPADPTKTGYTFAGWDAEIPATIPAENVTITAKWTVNQYTITFANTGDSTIAAITQDYNTAVTAPAAPEKYGYTFAGWDAEIPATMPAEDLTISATWTANEYDIVFVGNGGYFNDDEADTEETVKATFNEDFAEPEVKRAGYAFIGWSTDASATAGNKDLGILTTAAGATYYAVWSANAKEYTVELYEMNLDGTTYTLVDTETLHGTVGEAVATYVPAAKTGFTVNEELSILDGVIPAGDDEALVLEVYYDRNKVTLTYKADGNVVESYDVLYGTAAADMPVPADPTKEGYTFTGWSEAPATMPATAVEITANFTINQYTITFAETGDSTIDAITGDFGTAVTAPEDPTKTGYTFAGWDKEIPATIPAENVTITAKWTVNQYTITFDTVGGSEIAPITQDYGTAITAPADPTKEGNTFAGWDVEIPATMPAENITITAKWTVNQYTITFDTDGGSEVAPITRRYGVQIVAPADPTKTGYTFAGWKNADGDDVTFPFAMPAGDMTLTAQWTVNQYTITFDVDGGSEVAPITQDYNTAVTAPADPTKTGYTFAGWEPAVPSTMPAENVTVKAQWTINQYTITFDTDGGNAIEAITGDYGTAVVAPADPAKTGYTFAGWDAEIPATIPAENVTITAKWTINQYTITFDTVGGSAIEAITQDYNTAVTVPADPTKVGYTFAGWDVEIPTTMPAEDVTITAKWTINQYTITFDTDGGSAIEAITQDYNTAVTAPADPTKTGYTFAGWDIDVPTTMPAENVTVKAQWTINQYTITFDTDGGNAIEAITGDYGTAVVAPADPTKTGYTFAGWDAEIPATIPAENVTITAKWTVNQYTITFANTGDSTIAAITQYYNTAVTAPAAPEKYGYTFAGWDAEIPATMPAEDLTISATWTANEYDIVFVGNGGYFNDDEADTEETVKATFNEDFAEPEVKRAGYAFIGWSTDASATAGNKDLGILTTASGATYYAVWSANAKEYTVELYEMNLDGTTYTLVDTETLHGTVGEAVATYVPAAKTGFTVNEELSILDGVIPAGDDEALVLEVYYDRNKVELNYRVDGKVYQTYEVLYGTEAAEMPKPADPTKEGYTFTGWTEAPATMPATATNINATFSINQYTITFDVDGGSEVAPITQDYNTAVAAPADPTKTGYTFAGWDVEIPTTMPAEDVTITAKWTINQYTITFDTDGGSAIEAITQDYNTAVTAPADPTKVGYTFAGWDKEIPATMPAENVTIKANWTVNQYTITFDVDGGTAVDAITGDYGTAVVAPAAPTKVGYTFAGWDKEIPATIPAENVTITAKWTVNQYTITFANTGDSTIAAITQDYNTAVTAPAAPEKYGYTFAGWDAEIPATMPAEDLTISATWTANEYDIVFVGNGGYFEDDATEETVKATFNEDFAEPTPVREGYAFIGWSTDADATAGNKDLGILTTASGATYYAVWSANAKEYTVELYEMNLDGTTYTLVDTETLSGTVGEAVATYVPATKTGFTVNEELSILDGVIPAGDDEALVLEVYYDRNKVTLTYIADGNVHESFEVLYGTEAAEMPKPATDPTKEGYTFTGWSEAPATMPATAAEITANFSIESYTIKFDTDGGNEIAAISGAYGSEIKAPADPAKEGYTFAGWEPALPTTMPDLGADGTEATYKAKWTVNQYTITFDTDGGSAVAAITQDYGTAITAPAAPTKEGYTFLDWNTAIPATMPAEDMTIKALWRVNKYTITFDTDGGNAIEAITGDYGTAVVAPADPAKTGYTFAGWDAEIPATIPAENVTITAKWTINQYTITFDTDGGNAIEAITGDYGTAVVAPADPTKTGYTFAGWDAEIPATIPAENVTITAKWTINQYTITFDTDGGNAIEAITGDYGTAVVAPADPTKTGYTFAGWDAEIPATIPAENVTITAKWTANEYTITWVDAAGSTETKVTYGEAIVAPTPAEMDGHYFAMWTPAVPATMPAENLTITAIYETRTYVVNFYVNDKIVTDYSAEYGEVINLSPNGFTVPEGYIFDGWYDVDGNKVAEGTTVGSAVVNLYGTLTAGEFDAIFYLDDAKTEVWATVKTTFGEDIAVPAVPTKAGYVFQGWTPYVGMMDTEGAEFVAVWDADESLTVTYYVDGEVYEAFDVIYNTPIDVPADPEKVGYEFKGWAPVGKEAIESNIVSLHGTMMPAESVGYNAVFVISSFKATFFKYADSDHGPATVPAPEFVVLSYGSYNVGDEIIVPAAPVLLNTAGESINSYYTFKHWVDDNGNTYAAGSTATMSTGAMNFYPVYERVEVKLAVIDGTTGVIEKAHATDMEQWYVYGFTGRRINAAEFPKFFKVVGDGSYRIENSELSGTFGTGAKVYVTDNLTGEVVEEFYVIIFGDINGDGRINVSDTSALNKEVLSPTWSNRRTAVPYRIKSADINGDGRVNVNDTNILNAVSLATKTLNQQTGRAS